MKDATGIRVRSSREFKLKPKDGKNVQVIHIKDFGFVPDTLIFERKNNNWFVISAVLTPEEIKKLEKKEGKEK